MADGSTAAIAATKDQDLKRELQLAHAGLEQLDDIIAVVALALRGQGVDQDYACANMLETFAYPELEKARSTIASTLRSLGVEAEETVAGEES